MKNQGWFANRGIEAWSVAEKCGLLVHDWKKRLLWFLHALSWQDGGLPKAAEQLLEMFPDRLSPAFRDTPDGEVEITDIDEIKRIAMFGTPPTLCSEGNRSIEDFIRAMCVDSRQLFSRDGVNDRKEEIARQHARLPNLRDEMDSAPPLIRLDYFDDLAGALEEFKKRRAAAVAENFYKTSICKKMWEAFEFARTEKKMCLVIGPEGRGKSENCKAYMAQHLGEAFYTSLEGRSNETGIFRSLDVGIGNASGLNRTVPELKMRAKEVLKKSGQLLIIDEAHFAFQRTNNMTRPPDFIDWIDTALCNDGIPVVLVATPQILERMGQAAVQVGWNYKQFRRRISRIVNLEKKNTEKDIEAVIKKVFPQADQLCVEEILAYALVSQRDLSAVGDIATEVRHSGAPKVTAKLIRQIIDEHLVPGDLVITRAIKAAEDKFKPNRRRAYSTPPPMPVETTISEPLQASCREQTLPRSGRGITPVLDDTLTPV